MTAYTCDPPPSIQTPPRSHVDEILELLNGPALLVPCLWGTKQCFEKWKTFALDRMDDPIYLARLQRGNIGVVLGDVSHKLLTIDIDVEEDVEAFLELNPQLRSTLMSKGKRGCNIWLRIRRGKCPPSQRLQRDGKKLGEVRANGNMTIIYGKHPDGPRYTWPQPCRVMVIDSLDEINWLSGTQLGRSRKQGEVTHVVQEVHVRDVSDELHGTEAAKVVSVSAQLVSSSGLPALPEEILNRNLPVQKGDNHAVLFQFAREVVTFEKKQGGKYAPPELVSIFNRWYESATKEFLRESKTDYWTEFLNGHSDVKVPIGDQVFDRAWERAQSATAPPEVMQWFSESPDIQKLACLCKELQREFGADPFFLSCRMVGQLFGVSEKTGWKRLACLEKCGIIKTVEKGKVDPVEGYLASRFKYLLPIE